MAAQSAREGVASVEKQTHLSPNASHSMEVVGIINMLEVGKERSSERVINCAIGACFLPGN